MEVAKLGPRTIPSPIKTLFEPESLHTISVHLCGACRYDYCTVESENGYDAAMYDDTI